MSIIHLMRRTLPLLGWRGLQPSVNVGKEVAVFSVNWFDGTYLLAEIRTEVRLVWGEL